MEVESAPYPAHWEADILVRDGATMRVRPIVAADADALQAFHMGQSEESTYFRFFAPLRRLSDRDLRRLVQVDHTDRVALIVLAGEAIVAVARYDRISHDRAEVAFNVADSLQGQGLGSVLLEHLAAAARERGVSVFQADVLPGNAKMIRVFNDAGYDVVQRYEDGVISLEFTIDPTQRSLDVVASREHRTDAASMRRFLAPRRIVVVAGSQDGELAVRVAGNLAGLDGVTCVGEPLRDVAQGAGHTWVLAVHDVPDPGAELAVVAGTAAEVVTSLKGLAERGVQGVVVLSDGFDGDQPVPASATRLGTPDGVRSPVRQRQLLRAARACGVRLVGPRSFGVLTGAGERTANATLSAHPPLPGHTAVFCQSGALGLELMRMLSEYRLGVSTFVSAGHRADVSGNDLLQYAADVPGTRAVALYLESLGNARKFARVGSRVGARIPVVAVVGASQREAHGDALGRRAIAEAMLAAGVLVVPTMRALVETTQLFATQQLPSGSRILILSNSASVADLAAAQVAHLDPAARVELVPTTASGTAFGSLTERAMRDAEWDAALVLYLPPLGVVDASVAAATARLGSGPRPVLAVMPGLVGATTELTCEVTSATDADSQGSADQVPSTVPAYRSVEDAVAALTRAVRYARWRGSDQGELVSPEGMDLRAARERIATRLDTALPGERVELSRDDARTLLATLGIEVLATRIVRTTREALEAARDLGWPVAVKSSDPALRRRPDLGGVRLDVTGPIDLVDAIRSVRARQGGQGPVEIQSMAPLGVGCLVRGWVDPVVGPVISFGLAGDASDLLDDASYALPPLRTADIHRMVHSVRAAPRLREPAAGGADLDALEDVIARVADAIDAIPALHRVELDPALVSAQGAVVLDARVVLATQVRPDGGRRSLRG